MDTLPNTKKQDIPKKALSVRIDRAVRSSGLLAFLSPEDFQTLVALLTFVDESGRCSLSARTLAQMLNLSEHQAQRRLKKLCEIRWHGKPLVMKGNGRETGRFLPTGYRVMAVEGLKVIPDFVSDETKDGTSHISKPNGGGSMEDGSMGESGEQDADAVPLQVGTENLRKRKSASGTPDTDAQGVLPDNTRITGNSCVGVNNINKKHTTKRVFDRLLDCGMSRSIASELLGKYPIERTARQVEMLPFRNAKEPAAMLIKAIKEDWAAPIAYTIKKKEEVKRKAKAAEEAKEAEVRRIWHKRLEAAKSKLPSGELQKIITTAREKVRGGMMGVFHGNAPERLVDAEVNRIIARKYMKYAGT